MTKGFERAWNYGRYIEYYEFNFETDERKNSMQIYEQIIAETLKYD